MSKMNIIWYVSTFQTGLEMKWLEYHAFYKVSHFIEIIENLYQTTTAVYCKMAIIKVQVYRPIACTYIPITLLM